MATQVTWGEITSRLALTFLAGTLVGINRGEHARPAGLRTTLLLCLAASIAMIQANILMATAGKTSDSFVVLDLMRLPLGILTGVGFIGAGAILRREEMVVGVTTAATLWFVTVMGLCFGGGQTGLGLAALGLSLVVLWGMKLLEDHWKQDRRGALAITVAMTGPLECEILEVMKQAGYKVISHSVTFANDAAFREYNCNVRWRARPVENGTPVFLEPLARRPGILRLAWKPGG